MLISRPFVNDVDPDQMSLNGASEYQLLALKTMLCRSFGYSKLRAYLPWPMCWWDVILKSAYFIIQKYMEDKTRYVFKKDIVESKIVMVP